jgi:hypothetical protein
MSAVIARAMPARQRDGCRALLSRRRLPVARRAERALAARTPVPRVGGLALWAGFAAGARRSAADLPGGLAGWLPRGSRSRRLAAATTRAARRWRVRLSCTRRGPVGAAWLLRMPAARCPASCPAAAIRSPLAVALVSCGPRTCTTSWTAATVSPAAMTLIGIRASLGAEADPPLRLASAALAPPAVPFLASTGRPRACSWATSARSRGLSGGAARRRGVLRGDWPAWFPLLVVPAVRRDASATLARARCAASACGSASLTLLPAPQPARRGPSAARSRARSRCSRRPPRRSPVACARAGGGRRAARVVIAHRGACSRRLIIIGAEAHRDPMTSRSNWRAWLAFAHDVCAAALAWVGMYWLRVNLDMREPMAVDLVFTLAWIVPVQAAIFLALGLYRGLWRFASIARPAAHRARRGPGRGAHPRRPRDAAAADDRARAACSCSIRSC